MKIALLLLIFSTFLFSCKKSSLTPPPNGNYYLVVDGNWSSATSNGQTDFDLILPISFNDDSVQIKHYSFPLNSFDLSNGSGSHTLVNDYGEVSLTFTNNFNIVSLQENLSFSLAGGGSLYNYEGQRTNLPPTETEMQPHLISMSGLYYLNCYELNTLLSIDTSMIGLYDVTYQGDPINPTVAINGNNRDYYKFHSYYNIDRNEYDPMNQEILSELISITWKNDSINYLFSNFIHSTVSQITDSIIYNYSGNK